jgi:hypothetical protein
VRADFAGVATGSGRMDHAVEEANAEKVVAVVLAPVVESSNSRGTICTVLHSGRFAAPVAVRVRERDGNAFLS